MKIVNKTEWQFKSDIAAAIATGCYKVVSTAKENFGFIAELEFIGRYDAAGFPIPNEASV